jgi:hypothetical protein
MYKTIILPVVLYGYETWSLTLREEHRLRLFENRILRRIFRQMRDKIAGEWKELHNKEFHILYSSSNIIKQIKSRRVKWVRHVARMGEDRNVYKVFMRKPEGNNHLEDQGVDGRMLSEWILADWLRECTLDPVSSG